ncbi:MAG: hypothetical protein AB8U93_04250 [Francisella endosymbiont of Hyalomma scupense]
MVYIGVFPDALIYLCWEYAFRHLPTIIAISSLYFMPIMSLLLGWLLF